MTLPIIAGGATIGVNALDQNGNLLTLSPGTDCSVAVTSPNGITVGGGRIDGLGGNGMVATTGDSSAIAIGNGANASSVNATALGTNASATRTGAVALGSGSVADHLNSATELFTGTGLRTTIGVASVGSVGNERQIANVAGGTIDTDAVNVRQLRSVGTNLATSIGGGAAFNATTGIYTGPSYTIRGAPYTTVGGALTAVDNAVGANTTNITNLQTGITNGTIGLVQQDPTTRVITVGANTNGTSVSVAGTAGARRITGVAAGVSATDAVDVTQLNSAIAGVNSGSPAVASENSGGAAPPVASGLRSVAVGYGSVATAPDTFSVGAPGTERRIVNVAPGTLASGSTDAVNGSQLFATNNAVTANASNLDTLYGRVVTSLGGGASYNAGTGAYTYPTYTIRGSDYNSVGGAFAAVDNAVGANTTNITNLQTGIANGTIGLVQQDPTSRVITVGAATNGTSVNVAGTAGARRITGVAAGVSATDAVDVNQLNTAIAGLSFGGSAPIASENSGGAAAPVATGLRSVAVGYGSVATDPDTFSVGATGSERRVVNVAPGTLSAGSTDAVNGAQLFATNNAVTANASNLDTLYGRLTTSLGGGAAYNTTTGSYTYPTYSIRGTSYNSVGSAFAAVDSALGNIQTGGGGGGSAPITASDPNRSQPVAGGMDSVAAGYRSTASGLSSTALGDGSGANADYASSVGYNSAATGRGSDAIGSGSQAMAHDTTAIGTQSIANFEGSTAIGSRARAIADPTTAVGYYSTASGNNAVTIGAYSSASGDSSTAIGSYATATAMDATAIGRSSAASGVNSLALGQSAAAGGSGSIAIGQGSSAVPDNSVALGTGVSTTRTNQVAIGGAQSTYTLAGLGSGAGNAAQTGTTRFVTTDASGNLGTTDYGPDAMGAMSGQVAQLNNSVNQLTHFAVSARREARSGIASAMAMAAAPMPSAPGKTSWSTNGSAFKGEWATGISVAHRLDVAMPIAVTGGYSYGDAAGHGVRFGLAGEF